MQQPVTNGSQAFWILFSDLGLAFLGLNYLWTIKKKNPGPYLHKYEGNKVTVLDAVIYPFCRIMKISIKTLKGVFLWFIAAYTSFT